MSSRDFITVKVEDDDDEPVIIESSSLGGSQTGLKMQTMLERDSQATEEHHYLSQISYEGEDLSSSIQTDNSTDEMDYGLPHKRRRVPSMLENNTEDPFEGTSSSSQNLELGDSRRNPHFIEEENEILARMVRENYARLFGNLAARTSAVEKHEIWQRISKAVSSLGVHHRTIDKCKKRYHDLKGKVKSKLRKIEAHRRDTGTTLSVSMAPSEKIIQDLIPRAMVQRVHPMSDSQQVDTQCNSVLQWIEDEAGELEHSPEENTESYCHEINDFPQSPDPPLLGSGEPESEQKEVFIALEPLQTPLREDSEVFDDHQNQTQDHPALLNHLLREMKQYRRAQTRHNTAVLSNLRTIAQEMRTISSSFQTLNSTLQSLVTLASFIYAAPPQMDTPPRQSETSPLHSAAASPTNSSLTHMRIVSPQGSSTTDSRSSGKYHEESPQVTRWSERFRKKKT